MARTASDSLFSLLKPETPVPAAAQTVLGEQIRHLRRLIRSLAKKRHWDPETIHQLRVASRRLLVSLKVFAPFLPEKSAKRLKKKLGKVRRGAGRVRDVDVLVAYLEETEGSLPDDTRVAAQKFKKWLKRERRKSMPELEKAILELDERKFWTWSLRQIGRGVSPENHLSWGQVALPTLTKRLKEVLDAEPEALTGALEPLHRLRIAFKGLRYSLDIFRGCFTNNYPGALRASLVQLQDTLGAVNDIGNWLSINADFRDAAHAKKKAKALRHYFESLQESQKQEALHVLDRDWSRERRSPLLKNLVQVLPKPA